MTVPNTTRTTIVQMSDALKWNTRSHTATTMPTQMMRPMILPTLKIRMPRSLQVGSSRYARREPVNA